MQQLISAIQKKQAIRVGLRLQRSGTRALTPHAVVSLKPQSLQALSLTAVSRKNTSHENVVWLTDFRSVEQRNITLFSVAIIGGHRVLI